MLKKLNLGRMLLASGVLATCSTTAMAGAKFEIDDTRWVSVGAGIRASVSAASDSAPDGSTSTDFTLENARIYVAGQVAKDFKFTFNTEKMWGEYGVLDAVLQYEPSKHFNVWIGRMLTPADRIEMNGPFYGLTWSQYTVPLYPSDNDINNGADGLAGTYGRDEGITFWGTVGKFQYAAGAFEGYRGVANQSGDPLFATRLAYNIFNMEPNPAYFTSSTYFGKAGDILTIGLAAQYQGDGYGTATESGSFSGYVVDGLFEKPLKNGSVITAEGEYKVFDVSTDAVAPDFPMFDGKAYFGTFAYLFSGKVGIGQFQPYVRYTYNDPTDADNSSLGELGVNYVIDGHNLRVNLNVTSGDANASGLKGEDSNAILFGVQYQI